MLQRERAGLIGLRIPTLFPDAGSEKIRMAFESQKDVSFDLPLEGGPNAAVFSFVALPGGENITVLFRQKEASDDAARGG
jgi:hypothetical protein